jgi:hypothetical protein
MIYRDWSESTTAHLSDAAIEHLLKCGISRVLRVLALPLYFLFGLSSVQGADIIVPSGGDFQIALENARPGDTITLAAGAVYSGWFALPPKSGTDWITIRSSALSSLPPDGVRVTPVQAPLMPKLVSRNATAVLTARKGAHHYRFIGIEFQSAPNLYSTGVISLGNGDELDPLDLPHDLEFSRVYIHGDANAGGKRGISLNGVNIVIRDSYISDIKSTWQDSQAICGWNGPGPFIIENNYLEASGENVMFGGGRAMNPAMLPSDITIRHNHLRKPLSWKKDDLSFAGTSWVVKNLFESKVSQRVLIEANVFENIWPAAQTGTAIVLKPTTEAGFMPWAVTKNMIIRKNIFRNCHNGVNILGTDTNGQGKTSDILIQDNVFEGIPGNTSSRLLQLLEGTNNIVFDHNTTFLFGHLLLLAGTRHGYVQVTNNLGVYGTYGILGDAVGRGTKALEGYTTSYLVTGNVLAGGIEQINPPGNRFPSTLADIKFVDLATGNFRLAFDSPYRGFATDGRDPGADIVGVMLSTSGVIDGRPAALPTQPTNTTTSSTTNPTSPVTQPSTLPTQPANTTTSGTNPTSPVTQPSMPTQPANTTTSGTTNPTSPVTQPAVATQPPVTQTLGPSVTSLIPNSGSGANMTITATSTHSGGASQHYLAYILILPTPNISLYTAARSCLVEYNRVSNGMRLINDAGDNWLGPVSGSPLPKGGKLSNSQCTLDISRSSAQVSGSVMTVNAAIALSPTSTGVFGTFLQTLDVNGVWTGMTQFGNWTIPSPGAVRKGPYVELGASTSGTAIPATIRVAVGHTSGASNIAAVHLRITASIVGKAACHVVYFPGSNTLNLINDSETALVSPNGIAPGAGSLNNQRCTVGSASTRSMSGNNLTLNLPISFNRQIFTGSKQVYVNVFDINGVLTHWMQTGTLDIQ